jgi:hypothetical protein
MLTEIYQSLRLKISVVKISAFWGVTPYSMVDIYQCLGINMEPPSSLHTTYGRIAEDSNLHDTYCSILRVDIYVGICVSPLQSNLGSSRKIFGLMNMNASDKTAALIFRDYSEHGGNRFLRFVCR